MPIVFFLLIITILFFPDIAAGQEGRVYLKQTEGANARLVPVFVDQEGKQRKLSGDLPADIESGDKVRLTEGRSARNIRLLKKNNTRSYYDVKGQGGFMLVAIGWPGAPAPEIENKSSFQELIPWSVAASNGRWKWDPVTVETVTLPAQGLCAESSWQRATVQKLREMGYPLFRDYEALGLVVPKEVPYNCVPTAYAYLCLGLDGWSDYCGLSVYSPSYATLDTVIHELGHTMGLEHASSAPCEENGQRVSLSYKGKCTHTEYGDRLDPMGTSSSATMFNPFYSQELGWLQEGEVEKVALDGSKKTIELQGYAGRQGKRALRIPLPPRLGQTVSPGMLMVEYREEIGIDQALWRSGSYCYYGMKDEQLFIRYYPSDRTADNLGLSSKSYLLDTTTNTSTFCDGGLGPGETWSDPTGQLSIKNSGVSSEGALVSLETPSLRPSILQIKGPKKRVVRGRAVSFRLRSSSILQGLDRSDIYLKRGRCRINMSDYSSEYPWYSTRIRLYRCRPGVVRLGVRKDSLVDRFFLPFPARDVFSKTIRMKPKKRR